MSITCPACGASNRASAKFCRQCASLMAPLSPETQVLERDTELLPPRDPRRRRPGGMPWLLLSVAVAALCLGLLFVWLSRLGTRPATPKTVPMTAPVTAPPAVTAQARPQPASDAARTPTAPPAAAASQPVAAASGAIAAPLPPASEASATSAAAAPEPVAAPAAPAAAPATPAPRPAAKPRPRVRPAPVPPAPPPAPEPPPPPPAPVALPALPPPAAPAQTCGDRRFIARAVCMQSECDKPGLRNHPQCVRMREQQEALRRASGGG